MNRETEDELRAFVTDKVAEARLCREGGDVAASNDILEQIRDKVKNSATNLIRVDEYWDYLAELSESEGDGFFKKVKDSWDSRDY